MSSVNSILGDRAHRITRRQRRRAILLSAIMHFGVVGGVWAASALRPEAPKKRPRATVVRVVTAAALGAQRPPPPPPPPPQRPPPPKPTPTVTPPPPKPVSEAPVIPVEKKPVPKPTPVPAAATPPPPPPPAPARPRGVARGNPLGSSNSTAIGVEDPDFTYGYYVNQLVAALSSKWRRPPVPERINDARWYFRIQRDGTVTEIRLVDASGSQVFDDAARRAIEAATLPPLPRGYAKDYLGITVVMR